jgi:hypothetical protein
MWLCKLTLGGNRIARFARVNFLNPERKIAETAPGTALAWDSVTTGNLAGIDFGSIKRKAARSGSKRTSFPGP